MLNRLFGGGEPLHRTIQKSNVLPMKLQVDKVKLVAGINEQVAPNLIATDVLVLGYLELDPMTVRAVIQFQSTTTLRVVAVPWDMSLQFIRELGALVSENTE